MSDNKTSKTDFTKYEKIASDNTQISISEMAEMISIYYDEIKAIAKNLEEDSFPMPPKDIDDLHNSLLEYARIGTEFTQKFKNRAESLSRPSSEIPANPDAGTC